MFRYGCGMEKVISSSRTPEDHYEVLDVALTDILHTAGADVDDELLEKLMIYNRLLRIALGLPVEVAS